jgi:hydrogenase maturation protease
MQLGYESDNLNIRSTTIIIGLGNPLRCDDGIGVAVVEELRHSSSLPENVTIIDAATSDLEALLLMQGYQCVFIIDAANFGGAPGDWRCISIKDFNLIPDVLINYGSFHNMGLKDAISIGQTLNILPTEIYIYAVQPEELKISLGLSDSVSTAVQEVTKDIFERLKRDIEAHARTDFVKLEG